MKKFTFKYPTIAWVLLAIVLALAVSGIVWNLFNIVQYWGDNTVKLTGYFIIIALALALIIFATSIMLYGNYTIKGGKLYCNLGFVRTAVDLEDVIAITHFKKSDKLVVYFNDEKYMVIVTSPENDDAFVLAMREVNPKIYFNTAIDGEDTPV